MPSSLGLTTATEVPAAAARTFSTPAATLAVHSSCWLRRFIAVARVSSTASHVMVLANRTTGASALSWSRASAKEEV